MPPIPTPRQKLRQQLLLKRRNISPDAQRTAAEKIAATVSALNLFSNSNNIACYLACNGEVNVFPIMQQIWAQKKNCYLPVVNPLDIKHLAFVLYQEHDQLKTGRLGIPEPTYDQSKIIAPESLDLVIAPLVGFDADCNRLGQGGGCYDCTFAFKSTESAKSLDNHRKPCLLGVAYEWQKVPHLASAHWDVKLDMVVTEKNVYFKEHIQC